MRSFFLVHHVILLAPWLLCVLSSAFDPNLCTSADDCYDFDRFRSRDDSSSSSVRRKRGASVDNIDLSDLLNDAVNTRTDGLIAYDQIDGGNQPLGNIKKRKWKSNEMGVWGKRNNFDRQSMTGDDGARDENSFLFPTKDWENGKMHSLAVPSFSSSYYAERNPDLRSFSLNFLPDKRKWKSNEMAIWGKRNTELDTHDDDNNNNPEYYKFNSGSPGILIPGEDKRKWTKNEMATWGKRGSDAAQLANKLMRMHNVNKRKWKSNEMGVWGKRSGVDYEKRKWKSNEMGVWGKRGSQNPSLEKRKWLKNEMSIWGKRSAHDMPLPVHYGSSHGWIKNDAVVRRKRASGEAAISANRAWNMEYSAQLGKHNPNQNSPNQRHLETALVTDELSS